MTDHRVWPALALAVVALGAPVSRASGYGRVVAGASGGGRVTMDELLKVAGLDGQISGFGRQLADQLAAGTTGLSPTDRQTAARALHAVLDDGGLGRVIRLELTRLQAPASMQAVAAWYRGPVGARVAANAAALGAPEGQRALAAFAAQQTSAPAAATRLALVEQLEWLGGDADASAEILLSAMRAMALTLNAGLPAERRQRPGVLQRQLEEARPRLATSLRGPILRSIQFVYRDLSDEELRRSIDFHGSVAARWFATAVRQAFTRAAREAGERSARELIRVIPPERWGAPGTSSGVR